MSEPPRFDRVDSPRGSTLVLRGEFDLAGKEALREQLRLTSSEAHSSTCVDLSEVTFFDSSAVAMLLWANRRARVHQSELILVVPSLPCRRAIDSVGLGEFFTIEAD